MQRVEKKDSKCKFCFFRSFGKEFEKGKKGGEHRMQSLKKEIQKM